MNKVLDFLAAQWLHDLEVLSQPWMYYWVLVPAILYIVFFGVKWAVIMIPIWLPLHLAFGAIKLKVVVCDTKSKKKPQDT